ncbi:MAG: hypothetical protein MZV70_43470 [Desulfobacterales bacterium]|nr:hypothetical protein [Desulfobacterales bacterium]
MSPLSRAVGYSKDRTESNPYGAYRQADGSSKDVSLFMFLLSASTSIKTPALNLNYAEPDARGIAGFLTTAGMEVCLRK